MSDYQPMSSAPLDGTMFLAKASDIEDPLPCFRQLHEADEEGGPAISEFWTLIEGCPDEGGPGVAYLSIHESIADSWLWRPIIS